MRKFLLSPLVTVLALCAVSSACGRPDGPPTTLAVSSITPNTGTPTGATRVTITGVGFRAGATVSFGGIRAAASMLSSTTIVADAPAHAAGAVDVVVTNPDGDTAGLSRGYTYAPEPTFTVSGQVTELTDEEPAPVEGLVVTELTSFRTATTDANGDYTIAGIRATNAVFSTNKAGYVTESRSLALSADTRFDIRVARIATFTLSGMVYEVIDGVRVPIEGVVLYCDACGSPVGHTHVKTDANGVYSFDWVTSSPTLILLLGKEGYRYAGPPEHERNGLSIVTTGNTRYDIEFVRR